VILLFGKSTVAMESQHLLWKSLLAEGSQWLLWMSLVTVKRQWLLWKSMIAMGVISCYELSLAAMEINTIDITYF
jgi:hypothetical protein